LRQVGTNINLSNILKCSSYPAVNTLHFSNKSPSVDVVGKNNHHATEAHWGSRQCRPESSKSMLWKP